MPCKPPAEAHRENAAGRGVRIDIEEILAQEEIAGGGVEVILAPLVPQNAEEKEIEGGKGELSPTPGWNIHPPSISLILGRPPGDN